MKCQYCGLDVGLPFRCPLCGGLFCAEHRLPEMHMCQGLRGDLGFPRGSRRVAGPHVTQRPILSFSGGPRKSIFGAAKPTEVVHLSLAAVLVALVGLSTAAFTFRRLNLFLILLLVLIFTFSFILHEIGHKFTARRYGLWAEFRLSFLGVLVTIISIFTPIIKIVSPGSVILYGWADRRIIGRISLAGPLVNIALSILFLIAYFGSKGSLLGIVYLWGLAINAYIALFNMIPFSILDGAKIFQWNKHIWSLMFAVALILVAAYVLSY